MSDQRNSNGGVPSDFDRYFRDPAPRPKPRPAPGRSAPAGAAPPDNWFRDSGQGVPQNRVVTPPQHVRAGAAVPPAAPPMARPMAPAPAPRRKKPLWRRILRWLLVIVLIASLYFGFWAFYLVGNINKIDAMPADQIRNTPGAVTLIVGSDSYDPTTVSGSRTDTIMLMVDPLWGPPTLVSLPRDSWVEIPGNGQGKINSAFAIGGPPLLIETIEANTGLHIDHYMEIGFNGIVELTNAVGGLELCIDFDVDDANSGLVMSAGCSVLGGDQALAFVRMRYSDPKGDLGRIERQQQYISALLQKVASPATVLNPFKLKQITDSAAASLTVDEGTNILSLGRFGWGMLQVARGSGDVAAVPIANPDYRVNGQSAILWDEAGADALWQSLGAR